MRKIGFIGLGTMGKPMAKNLLSAGYSLVVYNRSKGAVRELEELRRSPVEYHKLIYFFPILMNISKNLKIPILKTWTGEASYG
jgi:6-phosphogluconate dehydrogenase